MRSRARPDDVEQDGHTIPVGEVVRLRPIGIDDWSDVRYLHACAFRTFIAPRVASHHAESFLSELGTPEYAERLDACHLTGAWFDGQLAGTAGWRPMTDDGRAVRIEGLFVQPLLTFMGFGSMLLAHAEACARRAGYTAITALATCHSMPFFLRSGYDVFAQGPGVSGLPADMPAFLMRRHEGGAALRSDGLAERPWLGVAVVNADDGARVRGTTPDTDRLLVED